MYKIMFSIIELVFFLGQSMIGIVTRTNLCVCENFSMQNLLERHHNDVTFKECRSGKWCESHLKNRSKFVFHASPINFPHSRKKITQWCNWTIKSWAFKVNLLQVNIIKQRQKQHGVLLFNAHRKLGRFQWTNIYMYIDHLIFGWRS